MSETLQTGKSIYGNFWYRFVAVIIDGILISIVGFLVSLTVKSLFPDPIDFQLVSGSINVLLSIIYGSIMESGNWQASIGKKVLNLKVTNIEGDPLNFSEALTRNLLKGWASIITAILPFAISSLRPPLPDPANPMAIFSSDYMMVTSVFGLISIGGYLMAAFTARRQAIHDIIAKTAVLTSKTKSSGTDEEW